MIITIVIVNFECDVWKLNVNVVMLVKLNAIRMLIECVEKLIISKKLNVS